METVRLEQRAGGLERGSVRSLRAEVQRWHCVLQTRTHGEEEGGGILFSKLTGNVLVSENAVSGWQ